LLVVLPLRERDGLGVGPGVGGGLSPDRMLSAFIAGAYPQSRTSGHVLTKKSTLVLVSRCII
jgi:hypothetical protein